jgi:hypothetical protein
MLQTVQLSITDGPYAHSVREALSRSCAWEIVEPAGAPDPSRDGVLVLDEESFERLPLPLSNPKSVVLVTRHEPPDQELLAHAWEAGIVSVVSAEDPLSTVLLAIMAAALRVAKRHDSSFPRGITPTSAAEAAPIAPLSRTSAPKRWKNQ